MKTFSFAVTASFLFATVLGAPAHQKSEESASNTTVILENGVGSKTVEACNAAPNCEVYEHPVRGTSIRFVAGHEPGSANYNNTVGKFIHTLPSHSHKAIAKRDGPHTNLQLGPNMMAYGARNPYDVITQLWNSCQYNSCSQAPFYVDTSFASAFSNNAAQVVGHPDGQYDGWDSRNYYIQTMLNMAQQQQSWYQKSWYCSSRECTDWGTHWEGNGFQYFSANRYANGYMVDFMSVWLELQNADGSKWDGGCAAFWNGFNSIVSAENGWASAFFGQFIAAICQ